MFYIIEKESQLRQIKSIYRCFLHIIPYNYKYHPIIQQNDISLVYIREVYDDKGYIICIKHSESLGIDKSIVFKFLSEKIHDFYVLDKKDTIYYFDCNQHIYHLGKPFDIESNYCMQWYYQKYGNLPNINYIIPISKHYQILNNIFNNIKPPPPHIYYRFINSSIIKTFKAIEENGITLNKEYFISNIVDKIPNPEFNIFKGKIYTRYNLNTITGRPSNSFNGINFLALSKTNGERDFIITSNDELVEMDFEAYHPRLIGELIGYAILKDCRFYEFMANQIFPGQEFTEEIKQKTKLIIFQQIYGGIRDEYKQIEFFSMVDSTVKGYFNKYQNGDDIETLVRIYNKRSYPDLTPNMLFNYIIQSMETAKSVLQIQRILHRLQNTKTKLILYTYDALLFDYSHKDSEDLLTQIQEIMDYPVRIKRGMTYGGLV